MNIHESANQRKSRTNPKSAKTVDTDKVATLARLIASDRDGEVLAAVAALKRALSDGGADINDMAAAMVAALKKPRRQPPTRWAPPAPDETSWESISMAWWAHYHRSRLSTSDKDYVHEIQMGHHFDCGRADAAMMWRLRNIVAKAKAARSAEDAW
jgi:hypothetical protein